MTPKKILLLVSAVIVCLEVSAQSGTYSDSLKAPWFVEKFKITAGGFVPISNTNIQVSGTAGDKTAGTDIDFERDLGFTQATGTFMLGFQYRLTRRSRFDLTWYLLNRNATHTLNKDIVFGNDTFKVNNTVNAFFNSGIYRFSYGYGIFENSKYELGLSFGFHLVHSNAGISAAGNNANFSASQNFGFTAPLPDFGIWGGYAFGERWAVNGEFDYLSLTVGDISGRILGANLLVTYRVVRQFDLALGYTGFNFRVDVTKPKLQGNFRWSYNGPSLTASYSFGKKGWTH